MLHGATEQPRGSAASSAILHSLDDWLCGGVAARGRAASPTKRGRYCIDVHVLFELRYFGNGTSHLYPPFLSLMPSRTVGRLRCSTARRRILRDIRVLQNTPVCIAMSDLSRITH